MDDSRRPGLSGGALKGIAVVTMFIDHFSAVLLLARYYTVHAWGAGLWSMSGYWVTRSIGRIAFPIYCFLICEGYRHTRSVPRYLLRLSLFALLSELPFDLAFQRSWFDMSSQNVFFTLALGLSAIALWEWARRGREGTSLTLASIAAALGCAALCYAAQRLETDYGGLGVLLILLMWLLREQPFLRALTAVAVFVSMWRFAGSSWIEILALVSFAVIGCYNGERGGQNKYFFYIFYPAHLLLLVLARAIVFPLPIS